MKKVTIVTAIKNIMSRQEYFKACVASVQNQDYDNVEHIIVDGGSTDGTIAFLKKARIPFLQKKDHGIYEGMNNGIALSTGDYILFLNSDDMLASPSAVSTLVKALEEKDADYAYGKVYMMDGSDVAWIFDDNLYAFWNRMPFSHQGMLVRRSLFDKVGLFNTHYKLASDYEWIVKCVLNDLKPVYVDAFVAKAQIGGATFVHEAQSKHEVALIYQDLYAAFYPFLDFHEAFGLIMGRNVPAGFMDKFYRHIQHLKNYDVKAFVFQKKKVSVSLFKIPVLQVSVKRRQTKVLLFAFLPLYTIKRKPRKITHFLLGLIPVWIKRKD